MSEKLVAVWIDKGLIIGDKLNIEIRIFENEFSIFLNKSELCVPIGHRIETVTEIQTMAYNVVDLCEGVEQWRPMELVKS